MARLNSWLSPDVTRALGWALIHSLWQCLALAALAAALMALSRRATVRYLVGVGALASMLAFPVATLFVLTTATSPLVSGSLFVAPRNAPAVSTVPIPAAPNAAPSRIETGSAQREPDSSQVPPVLRDFRTRLPLLNVLPWLVAAWLSGVAFFSLRFAGGFVLLEHRRRSQTAIPGAGILALCQDVQRQLGFERAIEYLECGWLQAPAVIGWLRPIVLLPVAALTGLTEDQLRAVIAHELAHVRRFDALVNLFQVLVETLLFYHPAVWWLNKRIRAERELCCDEIAVAASGNRLEYAKALTLMAEWESAPRLAMAANRGSLPERVLHILGRKPTGAGQRMIGLTGSVLFLFAAVAAANALLTIAAPPIAQAKESVRAVLSASQATVDHLARLVLRADEPTTSIPSPHQVHQVTPIIPMAIPDQAQVAREAESEKLVPPPADLSGLPPMDALTTPTVLAANAPPAATPSNQPPATASSPAPATSRDQSVAPVQAASNTPPAPPAKLDMNAPYKIFVCVNVPSGSVTGEVTSSTTIQMPNFACSRAGNPGGGAPDGGAPTGGGPAVGGTKFVFNSGPCKNRVHATPSLPWGRYCPNTPNTPWLTMTVQLANPADASKMPLGKLVTLKGDYLVITQNKLSYLLVQNARVLYVDPFKRSLLSSINPEQKSTTPRPSSGSPPQSQKDASAAAPAVASNVTPPSGVPVQVSAASSQPVISALGSADSAVALLPANPDAIPQKDSGEPKLWQRCYDLNHVTGSVIASNAIHLRGFKCAYAGPQASITYQFWPRNGVTLNVQLADPNDVSKMQSGKLVTVYGDFRIEKADRIDYLIATNAKVEVDPFGRSAPVQSNATAPRSSTNVTSIVYQCRNQNTYGRVLSPTAIELQGFACVLSEGSFGQANGLEDRVRNGAVTFGSCPFWSDDPSLREVHSGSRLGRSARSVCKFDVTMNVQLQDPADSRKMSPGAIVRLAGDFNVVRRNAVDYLAVTDASVLETVPVNQPAPAANSGPRPGTVEAVQCLLRQSPPACEQMFVGKAGQVATAWVYVSAEQNFNRGPLISSNYWGRGSDVNIYLKSPGIIPKANLDVFDIKFAHRNYTFWISPPDADGKIRDVIVPVP